MNKYTSLLIVIASVFVFVKDVEAKVLPQVAKGGKSPVVIKNAVGTGINVFPRIRADKKALVLYFTNLQNATSVSYLLTYKTAGQEEGAMGGVTLNGSSTATQELLFGTCSKNVCRYHTRITDARLEVSYTSKTGKKYLKKYKIRI